MNSKRESIFGDKNTFAIHYVPGYSDKSKKYFYAYCHLVLGGQIIGDIQEICYLNSWKNSIEKLKNQLLNNFGSIFNSEFKERNDREIFELIEKANQLPEDYKSDFHYLPVLDSSSWYNCHFNIDETTDAYTLYMIEFSGKIKLLWEGWCEQSPKDQFDKLFSVVVNREFVIETLSNFLQKIETDILNYSIEK
jgi:hypothetical protein